MSKVTEFKKHLNEISSYNELREFLIENPMTRVAAKELSISRKKFSDIISVVESGDFSVEYLRENYNEIIEANKEAIEKHREEQRKINRKREEESRKNTYEYDDYWDEEWEERSYRKYEALYKNQCLVADYESFKKTMCGIGQKKVKLMLNKLIKTGDIVAKMYRTVLEIECVNINAKKYRNNRDRNYKDDYYKEKETLLKELIELCESYNFFYHNIDKIIYGKQRTDNYSANYILYFELPRMEQVSFHTNLDKEFMKSVPDYGKEWDGGVNVTLQKIEKAVMEMYGEEIEKIKNKK